MSEAELREGLRAAVGDEPPLDFDPDELIQRAQHARRRRRALVAVAVATLALTGTVLSLPGVLDQRPGIDVAGAPVLTTTASPSPPDAPSAVPPAPPAVIPPSLFTSARVDADTTFLSDYVADRFARLAPDVKGVTAEFTDTRAAEKPGYLNGFVHFIDALGPSALTLHLSEPSALLTREQFCAGGRCDPSLRRSDGSHLEFATSIDEQSKLITQSVAHFRTDGSVVQVSGYNYNPVEGGGHRDGVPVPTELLVELATDPKIAMR